MGNTDSRLTYLNGTINLSLDREGATYISGQPVSGRVALRIGDIFYSEKLQILFRGKSSVRYDPFDYDLSYGEGETKGESIVHQQILTIFKFDQMRVMPGIYEFPF